MTKQKQPQRWMPEHFPIGTIVKVNLSISEDKSKEQVFEVARTLSNGPGSFVIETTQYDDTLEMMKSFNMSWVVGIIKRSSGGPSYDPRNLGEKFRQDNEKHAHQDREYFINQLKKDGHQMNVRGYYFGYSPSEYTRSLVYYHSPAIANTELVDYDAIAAALSKQSFVRWISITDTNFKIFRVNKVRSKRWLKQNFRRFLRSVESAMAEEAAYMDKIYLEDLESDHDRTFERDFCARTGSDYIEHDLGERQRTLNDNIDNNIKYNADSESTDVTYLIDDSNYNPSISKRLRSWIEIGRTNPQSKVANIDTLVGYHPEQTIIQGSFSTEDKSVFKKTS